MVADGTYSIPPGQTVVPLCDGAGEVIEKHETVTRVSLGDRVIPGYWPHWIDGWVSTGKVDASFGAQLDGTLTEELVVDEQALTIAPSRLSATETPTIGCAGVTAWNALFVQGRLSPGSIVLLLGTGGVSIWALQLAAAAGLRPIVTSSDDAKLARARELGAVATINYAKTPEWQDEVKRLTGGLGVDLVLEIGGPGTMPRSVASTRLGGTLIVIGGRAGADGGVVDPGALIGGVKTLVGNMVGNRTMQEDLVRFIEMKTIRPVIDRVFNFGDAADAFEHMRAGAFGKVVIDTTR
jgi:NADPH:quinone reductase-like Zn-dependent oxidoreductase